MKYIDIQGLDKKVSKIVFGTAIPEIMEAVLPVFGPSTYEIKAKKECAYKLMDGMYELGINTFDCAAHYGEEIIGEWSELRGIRKDIVIITKCAHPNRWRKRVTEFDILSDLYDSMAKLRTDYIDVYLLHRDNEEVPVEIIIELMNELKNEGKIKVFGVSNWTTERIKKANEYARKRGITPFVVSSPNFGLAEQVDDPWGGGCVSLTGEKMQQDREWYMDNDMFILAYSSLGRGFFSGKFKSNEKEKASQLLDMFALKGYFSDKNFERLKRVEKLSKEKGLSVPEIAMAWIHNQNMKISTIIGTKNIENMHINIIASEYELTNKEVQWLNLETDKI